MGLLDSIIGALGQAQGGGRNPQGELLNLVLGMLANDGQGGGLGGLVGAFQRGGLGDVMSSWISTGRNLPISPEQLGGVLGQDRVGSMASQLGLDPGDLLGQLSQVLPQVVDQLTPQGQVPAGGLGDIGDLLAGLTRR